MKQTSLELPTSVTTMLPDAHPASAIVNVRWPEGSSFDPYEIQACEGWHSVARRGLWDSERLLEELREHLVHSRLGDVAGPGEECRFRTGALIFSPASNLYIALRHLRGDDWFLRVWGPSAEQVSREFKRLRTAYLSPDPEQDSGEFYVLCYNSGEPDKRRVKLPIQEQVDDELELHYGGEFRPWHVGFVKLLKTRKTGVSILQGPPGTGKTSYLRFLLYALRATHRFYYLPISVFPMLAAPSVVDFWMRENELHKEFTKVIVIEDAEELLMQRDSGNQESVSNLLNIADGLLGDFLKLHVICTINAPIENMDPAVMRPGRLVAAREFRRLTAAEAHRLATAKGLQFKPRDEQSLAEIYNSDALALKSTGTALIGFAA